jgi:uncharacterized protein YndB with AHSA1/START domain
MSDWRLAPTIFLVLLLESTQISAMDSAMQIEKTYELPFPPSVVYDAWVSSDTVIPPATAMDIDPIVGGHYRLIMETPDFNGKNEGRFCWLNPRNV